MQENVCTQLKPQQGYVFVYNDPILLPYDFSETPDFHSSSHHARLLQQKISFFTSKLWMGHILNQRLFLVFKLPGVASKSNHLLTLKKQTVHFQADLHKIKMNNYHIERKGEGEGNNVTQQIET